jgi:hypothetical protein
MSPVVDEGEAISYLVPCSGRGLRAFSVGEAGWPFFFFFLLLCNGQMLFWMILSADDVLRVI